MPTETQILSSMLDSARQLTRFYLRSAGTVDKSKTFTIDGYTTNSILWITAHLAWAEDYLILKCVGNKGLDIPWFELFALGKEPPAAEQLPSWDEVYSVFKEVHRKSLELLRSLPDSVLDEPNHGDLEIFAKRNKRTPAVHCCRHESSHAGQIGMILRMHGVETF